MTTEPQSLEEPGARAAHVVVSTSAWVHRCAKRMLELDPELDPLAAMQTVDDLATSARWRSMLPENVAETLYAAGPGEATPSFATGPMPHA